MVAGVAPELHALWDPCCVVARAGVCGVWDVHSSGGCRYNHDPAPPWVPAGSGDRETLVVTVQQQWGAASYDTPMPTPHTAGP